MIGDWISYEDLTVPEKLRIFVSSPGDVAEERVVTRRVLDRLIQQFAGVIEIEPIFWEHEPLLSSDTFQAQIPRPSETDIVVTILWARLGTRLPKQITRPDGSTYQSGTEYEFEDALAGRRIKGTPDLIVYRKQADPVVSLRDEKVLLERLQQKQALDQFFQKWFHGEDGTLIAAFHPFSNSGQFEELIEQHIGKLVDRHIKDRGIDVDDADEKQFSLPHWEGSPFRGLDVFEVEHAPIFFGRTKAIGEVLDALRRQAAQGRAFLLLLGASGCGKSSLIRAGVLPLLSEPSVIEGVGLWRRTILRPSDSTGDLFDALAAVLVCAESLPELTADGTSVQELAQMLRQNPAGANMLVKGALSQAASKLEASAEAVRQPEARLALVIDQFEEIFTRGDLTADHRTGFIAALASLARSGRVWVVATLRSDYYDRCSELPELVELKAGGGQIDLLPPTAAEIGQMIRNPAFAARLRFEQDPETHDRLDDVLRDAATAEPASLPLLEFTLDELFKARTSRGMLTLRAYRELGGVEGALANRADAVFQTLSEPVRESLPRLFRMLVTLPGSDSEAPTRRTALRSEIQATPATETLAEAFVAARLLTADQADGKAATMRVTHEALLTRWPPLVAWLKSDRELLLIRGRVATAAASWRQEGELSDLLLAPGKPLEEAGLLLAAEFDLTPEERAFIAASLARARRASQLKIAAVAALVLLALVATLTGILAQRNAQQARNSEMEAQRLAAVAKQESSEAKKQRQFAEQQRDRAEVQVYASLVANAYRAWKDGDAGWMEFYLQRCRTDLRGWEHDFLYSQENAQQKTLAEYPSSVINLALSPNEQFFVADTGAGMESELEVWRVETAEKQCSLGFARGPVAFTPDSKRLVAKGEDDELKLFDVSTGEAIEEFQGPRRMHLAAFSPDGKWLVGSSFEHDLVLCDASTGEIKTKLEGHTKQVVYVGFDSDSQHIRSCSEAGEVIRFDLAGESESLSLQGPSIALSNAAFSPDGKLIAAGCVDGAVRVWNATTGAPLHTLRGHVDSVFAVAFQPAGTLLASAGSDPMIKLWDLTTGSAATDLIGHASMIMDTCFSADGQKIYSAGSDRTVKQWDLTQRHSPVVIEGHESTVCATAFSPDDQRMASGDAGGGIQLWDAQSGKSLGNLPSMPGQIFDLSFTADGQRIVCRDIKETVRMLAIDSGKVRSECGGITSLSVETEGKRIAGGGHNGSIYIWDAANLKEIMTISGHKEAVYYVAFHPGGQLLTSCSQDGTCKTWDLATGQATRSWKFPSRGIAAMYFTAAGPRLINGNGELYEPGEMELWDAVAGRKLLDFQGHPGGISEIAVSPDGRRLVSGGYNGEIKLWDTATGVLTLSIDAHSSPDPEFPNSVCCVAFSHDGRRIASGGMDRKLKIWDASLKMPAMGRE